MLLQHGCCSKSPASNARRPTFRQQHTSGVWMVISCSVIEECLHCLRVNLSNSFSTAVAHIHPQAMQKGLQSDSSPLLVYG